MSEGPPPSAASSSKLSPSTEASPPGRTQTHTSASGSSPSFTSPSNSNQPLSQAYTNYTTWNGSWQSVYPGYFPASPHATQTPYAGNPYAAHIYQSPPSGAPQPPPENKTTKPNVRQPGKIPSPPSPPVPSLPEPETYKDWDEVIRKFLMKTKMTQASKGFENDLLVINPEWEQKMVPEALKEMVVGLQSILDRISGKQKAESDSMEVESNADSPTVTDPLGGRPLEERKLDYAHDLFGVERRSPSSINKSISQFLSRTRARNNASNRSEFLYSLAEKKLKLAQSQFQEEGRDAVDKNGLPEREIVSCARVDAKPIDREKQIKYDIAKYGEGPLTKTVKTGQDSVPLPDQSAAFSTSDFSDSMVASAMHDSISGGSEAALGSARKRKLNEMNDTEGSQVTSQSGSVRSGKGKAKEERPNGQPSVQDGGFDGDSEEAALASATAVKHPGLDERLKNLEEHIAIRYVPTPPRTLMARLKYLEDHIIKLEKEYPPWAALHFNQPHRGWPPPPRATPVIVPPHLRAVTSSSSTPADAVANPGSTTAVSAANAPASNSKNQTIGASTNVKPRKTNSSLHKAVLERLEVQKAMSEMSGKGSRPD